MMRNYFETTASSLKNQIHLVLNGDTLRAKAFRSTGWVLTSGGVGHLMRLASNLVLTRLLFPEAFGLMALVGAFMIGLAMFSDLGIGASIIQNKRGDDPDFLNSAWCLQILRGFILWLFACLIAYPISLLYEEPLIAQMLPVVGLGVFISGFNSTKYVSLKRHLSYRRIFFISLATKTVQIVCMILLAWWLRSVWALVLGGLIGNLVSVILSHIAIPGMKNRFVWEKSAIWELFHFGKWIFLSTAFSFLGRQSDRLILGLMFSFAWLGVYSIAVILVGAIQGVLDGLMKSVGYAVYSKLNHLEPSEFQNRIKDTRFRILLGWSFLCAFFICFIDQFVIALWDPRYAAAGWMATFLGLSMWPRALFFLTSPILLARGIPKYQAFSQGVLFMSLASFLTVGYLVAGEFGAIIGISASRIPPYFVAALGSKRLGVNLLRQDLIGTLVFLAFLMAGGLLRYSLGFPMPGPG